MPPVLRLARPALAALALGLAGRASAQTALPKDSPFLPGGNAAAGTAAGTDPIEFAAVRTIGNKTDIDLYDTQAKKNQWVPVGGNADGLTVVSYNARIDQVVARIDGVERLLTLRKEHGNTGPAPIVTAPAMSFATPPPTPAVESNAVPPAAVADTSAPAASPVATPAPTAPAAPLSVARQEEEARMLVSDLLEIGMAQRKAYEEAQKKAADPSAAQSTPAPAPAAPASGG